MMRLNLLVAIVTAVTVLVSSGTAVPTDHKGAVAHHGNIAGTRLLRTATAVEEDNEDRLYIPGIETASNYIWSLSGSKVTTKTLEGWLQSGKSTDDVFKLLKLDKAGDNLLSSPMLESWLTYANAFGLKNPGNEATMLNTFRNAYGDVKLALILQAAKKVPDTKMLAKGLQIQQFKLWKEKRWDPAFVYSSVFKLSTEWKDKPAAIIVHKYNQFYKHP
ncbi:putative secreted RxLR effector protein [Phytophthora cinnamomi]|uniref:putative secreted RxLR effector protein n=1 Tax=Phytophthora cinnamomi TaxID=4785 RepID=UPI00355A921A|nr:putative secreted RxLR effector protein [Phytophthora cinnamomi]